MDFKKGGDEDTERTAPGVRPSVTGSLSERVHVSLRSVFGPDGGLKQAFCVLESWGELNL